MRFREIFTARSKDRSEGGTGPSRVRSNRDGTKWIDPALLHPQSYLQESGPSKSAPSTLRRHKSDSDATAEASGVSDHRLSVPNTNESKPAGLSSYVIDPSAAYENKLSWKSTAYASAKVVIDVVKESSDVFVPLKSVAAGLSAILKHCDQTIANRQTIESLIPRVEGLAESLSTPVPEHETKERGRREVLKRKLENILRDLEPLAEQGKIAGFFKNVKDAEKLAGLTEDIRDVMMDYQTSLQQDIYDKSCRIIDTVDLTLLNGMYHTADAGYLSGNRQGCLKGTRKDVLLQIERWLMDDQDQRVFWLNGLAGTGKSTIAQTFAEISFADGKLGASFFCSRDFEERSNLQAIFPTLAFQLAYRYPPFREQLLRVLRASPDIGRESLCSQLEKLIVGPFKVTRIPTLIIIDALDECKDEEPASAILSVLSRYVNEIPQVKFFITGRPEPRIRSGFRLESLRPITEVLRLHDVDRSSVDGDIKLFFRTRLADIAKTRSDCDFTEDWPSSYDIDVLCKKAAGLFIYASTVVKFVASKHHLPTERLTVIILLPQCTANEGKSGIDLLYTKVLEQAFQDVDSDEQGIYSRFKLVVGAVVLIFHPLSRKTLSDLLKNCGTPSHISNTLRSLHSLLLVPASEVDPVRIFHKSFPDFLTDPERCKDERFFVDDSAHHIDILFSCLNLMEERLKKDICGLDDYAILNEVKDLPTRKGVCIGGALEYACRFWTKHLVRIPGTGPHVKRVQDAIYEFFTRRLLFWVEVLSLTGYLGVGVYAINEIRQWYISAGIPTSRQADDSQRLILEYFDVIYNSPSHVYHSALPFPPSSSWLRECYKAELELEVKVVTGPPTEWDTCSRTIFLEGRPSALAHRGDTIAVGLSSNNIVIIDAITGTRKSVLSEHTETVLSLVFSPDGTLLVSGSEDKTVKLWDLQTGGTIKTFSGHDSAVPSVSISPDSTTIASGSRDGTIHLWDVRTGKCHHTVIHHKSGVTAVSFSPVSSRRLISSSVDSSVRQWDVDGNQIGSPCLDAVAVTHVAYTSDGTRFVSCGGTVATVRDSESGVKVVRIDIGNWTFRYGCFSPNGRFLALAAGDAVYVWDITASEPRLVDKFIGHTGDVISVVFSASLISGSQDRSVKFWQIGSSSLLNAVSTSGKPKLHVPAAIESVALFAKDGIAVTKDWSGIEKTWDIATGECKSIRRTGIIGETGVPKEVPDKPRSRLIFVDRSTRNGIRPAWIQDTVTGNLVFRLPERYTKPSTKTQWDGRYLIVGCPSGEVVIMDFNHLLISK